MENVWNVCNVYVDLYGLYMKSYTTIKNNKNGQTVQ